MLLEDMRKFRSRNAAFTSELSRLSKVMLAISQELI
jgi:hypothetical protein